MDQVLVEARRQARAREHTAVSLRNKTLSDREVLVQQILREALTSTLSAFPDLAARLSGDEARRRIASTWADVLLEATR